LASRDARIEDRSRNEDRRNVGSSVGSEQTAR